MRQDLRLGVDTHLRRTLGDGIAMIMRRRQRTFSQQFALAGGVQHHKRARQGYTFEAQ